MQKNIANVLENMQKTIEQATSGRLVAIVDMLFSGRLGNPSEFRCVAEYATAGDYTGTARAFVDLARSHTPEAARLALSIADMLEPGNAHHYSHVLRR